MYASIILNVFTNLYLNLNAIFKLKLKEVNNIMIAIIFYVIKKIAIPNSLRLLNFFKFYVSFYKENNGYVLYICV